MSGAGTHIVPGTDGGATYVFKAEVKITYGYGPRVEEIEYVITLDSDFDLARARAVFQALHPSLKIERVKEFRRVS